MNLPADIATLSQPAVLLAAARGIGWAILHSLWQGAFVAAVAAVVLGAMRHASAQARYVVACVALVAMAAAWSVTAVRAVDTAGRAATRQAHTAAVQPIDVPPALGPAGPNDTTPAIQPLPASALSGNREARSWRARLEPWSMPIAIAWLVGVGMLSARLAIGWTFVERLRRTGHRTASYALSIRAGHFAARLGIRRVVRVASSARVAVPTLVGWLRPVVIVPVSVLAGLTPEQLDTILVHELAHVRRHDYLINLCQSAIEVVLFYHPACWWLSRRIRTERELCCDDIVVQVCGDPLAYARALADVESLRDAPAPALAATDGSLLRRVRRLLSGSAGEPAPSGVAAIVVPALMVATLFGAHAAGAGTQSVPVQEAAPGVSRTVPANEGVIEGQVVDSASGRPVAGATIEIATIGRPTFSTADADGRYEARGVRPGAYRLTAKAPEYVMTHYGQAGDSSFDFGTEVEVRGGTVTRGIDFRLRQAAALNGRVLDEEGRPIAGVEIELVVDRLLPDGRRAGAVQFAQTDEAGAYRLTGIRPGDYKLRAHAGREMPKRRDGRAYRPTFYPEATDAATAQALRLHSGQELFDVNVTMATSGLLRVSGRVIDPTRPSVKGIRVILHSMGVTSLDERSAVADAEGRFTIADLPPSTYMVLVDDRTSPWVGLVRWMRTSEPIVVDRDVTDLELRAEQGAHIDGRVVTEAGTTRRFNPADVRIGFEIRRPNSDGAVWMSRIGCKGPTADGRFTCESPGGLSAFVVEDIAPGWMVKTVNVDGTPSGDELREFGASAMHEIEVILTDRVSALSGLVVDRNGRALTNYSVVVFSTDRAQWHAASRFVRQAQSNNEGQFRLERLPAGEYLSVAVPGLPPRTAFNPEVLERLEGIASRVRIAEGEQRAISIRASPLPPGLAPEP